VSNTASLEHVCVRSTTSGSDSSRHLQATLIVSVTVSPSVIKLSLYKSVCGPLNLTYTQSRRSAAVQCQNCKSVESQPSRLAWQLLALHGCLAATHARAAPAQGLVFGCARVELACLSCRDADVAIGAGWRASSRRLRRGSSRSGRSGSSSNTARRIAACPEPSATTARRQRPLARAPQLL
jgi:hypothetical protein